MYVRLSDGVTVKPAKKKQDDDFPFVYIPQSKMYIREDYLDDLDNGEWRQLMAQIASYQPHVESGQMSEAQFMADRASRKAKREERQAKKETKSEDKHKKKDAKTAIKNAKAEAKKGKGAGGGILGTVMSGVSGFLNKDKDSSSEDEDTSSVVTPPVPPADVPFYKTATGVTLISVGAAGLIAGGIYLATRKK